MHTHLTSLVVILFLAGVAQAQQGERLLYGGRAGMEVTILGKSGIGTRNAVIKIKFTKQNASELCEQYVLDKSTQCINRVLREDGVRLKSTVSGNCKAGTFRDMYGRRFTFRGPNKNRRGEFSPEYIFLDQKSGKVLQEGMTSGYGVVLGVFEALCPNRVASVVEEPEPEIAKEGKGDLSPTNVPAYQQRESVTSTSIEKNPMETTANSDDAELEAMSRDMIAATDKPNPQATQISQPISTTASDLVVCKTALSNDGNQWESASDFKGAVDEALKRNLSIERCRVALGYAQPPAAVK